MTSRALALAALLLASACNRQAPVENRTANQTVPAPQPAPVPAATQATNSAAPVADKPQQSADDQSTGAVEEEDNATPDEEESTPPQRTARTSARGCAAELSLGAAEELVRVCEQVSPATHPPCNIQNSCATIRQEINRSCRLLGSDAPEECRGG